MERETGIEPATNSLEGCDSTTELLPPCSPQLPVKPPVTSGGEGRVRTSVATRAADLQSAAIDRSATSPRTHLSVRGTHDPAAGALPLADVIHESLSRVSITVYRGIRVCSVLP